MNMVAAAVQMQNLQGKLNKIARRAHYNKKCGLGHWTVTIVGALVAVCAFESVAVTVTANVVLVVGAVNTNVGKLVVVAFTWTPEVCTQLKPPGAIVPVSCVHVEPIPNPEEITEGVAVAVNVTAEPLETVCEGVLTVTLIGVITLPSGTLHVTGLVGVLEDKH